MKNGKFAAIIAVIGIMAVCVTCDNGGGTTHTHDGATVPADTPRTLTFGENTYTVTIKSNDQFTAAEWTALCDKVVAALETAYGTGSNGAKNRMRTLFEEGVTIVFEKNPTDYTNYKVGGTTLRTLYLNVDSIETANYANAIGAMYSDDPTHENIKG